MNWFPARPLMVGTLAVCLMSSLWGGCQVEAKRSGGNHQEGDSAKNQPTPVEIVTVGRGSISAHLQLNGVLGTEAEIKVYPLVSGHVARIRVEEGDRVRVGDTLLVLEDKEIVLSERRLRLELDKSEQDLERVRQLAASKLVPDQDLKDSEYQASRARLAWESARLTVQRSRVTAPIGGVVSRRLVQAGDFVSNGTQLFTLVDDGNLIAVLDVPERELGRLKLKQSVSFTVSAAGRTSFSGWIKRVSPVVDPASGTVRVTVGLRDSGHQLRAGMYARFSIVTDTREQAMLVPKRSLVYDRDQTCVWIAGDTTAVRRVVERGYEDEERLEVVSGLEPGERLIVVGQGGLKPGGRIRVVRADGVDLPEPVAVVQATPAKPRK